jgi:phospholipase/lecithinase/hemolysin
LKGQVELFRLGLLGRKPSSRALYVIATGANDYRDDPFNVPMNPTAVVKNIEDAIVTLYRLGARHVMVFDLPDLGQVPANLGLPEPNPATLISAWHNSLLYPMLDGLRVRFPSLHLVTLRLQPLFDTIPIANKTVPALDVYTPPPPIGMPPQSACLFVAPVLCQDVETSLFNNLNLGHVFWDIVHPTTEAHWHLADYMHTELVNSYD